MVEEWGWREEDFGFRGRYPSPKIQNPNPSTLLLTHSRCAMPTTPTTLTIRGALPRGVTATEIRVLAAAAFRRAGGRGSAEISLSIITDAAMRTLNRRHRGKDATTDVLSFSYDGARDFVQPPKSATHNLGDVFISLPQVRRQAKRIDRTVREEFALMVVHGVLHLMGFDHATPSQERTMFGLQQEILMRSGFF